MAPMSGSMAFLLGRLLFHDIPVIYLPPKHKTRPSMLASDMQVGESPYFEVTSSLAIKNTPLLDKNFTEVE